MADAGHFAVIQAHLSLKLFCIILVIKLFVKTVEDRSVLLYCLEELSQGEWEGQPSGEYIRRR